MDIYAKTKDFYESVTAEKRRIGKSVFGRDLFAVKVGKGRPVGLAQYAMHGREYCTAELAFLHHQIGVAKGSLWMLPLVNPDGALLSEIGLSTAPSGERERLVAYNGGSKDFRLWKANGRGVDLNVNFPAKWGKGEKNVQNAGSENYIGTAPCSEPESLALKNFTEEINPDYTVSYHTKGEEIYWYFYQSLYTCPRDKRLAQVLSVSTGYPLAMAKNSAGGYKDWCILRRGIPAFTVEAGGDEYAHPLTGRAVEELLKRNRNALYDLSRAWRKEE